MDEETFDSVTWDTPNNEGYDAVSVEPSRDAPPSSATPSSRGYRQESAQVSADEPVWEGYLDIEITDSRKEHDNTKDAYISYLVTATTDLSMYSSGKTSSRRRFQDFVFLRENLVKDFPACIVPPMPGKHRLEYVTGDRFGDEFVEHRRSGLETFLTRVARHPTLQRALLLKSFLESSEWTVEMHKHLANPPGPEPTPSFLENFSDTLLNAFSRVRKPDERFMDVRESLDQFEDGANSIHRLLGKSRSRTSDLANDYRDLALSVQGLGFLESGITDPLNTFSNTLLDFSNLLKNSTTDTIDPALSELQSLLSYGNSHRAVLKLRDQKQLDLEALAGYLSADVIERDRLAAGGSFAASQGLTAYLKEKMDSIRGGGDEDRLRYEKMRKLDGKIKELRDAVTNASDTSEAFDAETLKEHAVFQHNKQSELKDMLGQVADANIEMYKNAMKDWENLIPVLQKIRVDI